MDIFFLWSCLSLLLGVPSGLVFPSLFLLTDGVIGVLGVDGVGILGWAVLSMVDVLFGAGFGDVVASSSIVGTLSLKKEAAAPFSCSLSWILLLRTSLLPVVGSFSCLQMACSSSLLAEF